MDSSATPSLRASRRRRRQAPGSARESDGGADAAAGAGEEADAELRCASARVLANLPEDLARIRGEEVARQLDLLTGTAPPDESRARATGSVLMLRRRVLDLLRAELLRHWREHSTPTPPAMLAVMERLEVAAAACRPGRDSDFAAELADHGGLDLVVEVGHDMRSPLTSILFLAETLHRGQSGPLNDVQKRQIGIIYGASLGLLGIASDMIEVARGGDRLEARKPEPFSLNDILGSVSNLVRPTAEEKGLAFSVDVNAAPRRIGYPLQLSRVLLNLTTNSLKFTHEGSVTVSVRPLDGGRVAFTVADTGPGIPPEAMESLFQPFRREPGRRTGYYFSTTGLGLAICDRLVTAMGSELRVETAPGSGTSFHFDLDLPPAELL